MSALLASFLALIPIIVQDIPGFIALWNQVKGGLSATDQATIDAILAALSPKTDADLATLKTDAAAA